ncbi:hypothetical protein Aab01nite_60290 [Paractinoplanes abujensis]|uniref:Uncharacterized protein n=1 Tax=Paractinoplanes abujensis TaxID=882441 RepID=A0A7W7G3M4_9ACTN|nr:hypothetical protein [Actinoplanes abujensis]MBB4696443.1 hypothetical protein [Actinoplanes abujensis]GID22439.1 hypothetical protein Aab01nite_60290 [Actinoplanes abujensis]
MAGASNNGGFGSSPDDLPDLPEEWGVIVIPDDLSALSDEVDAVRAELRLAGPPTRWQRLIRRPAVRKLRRAAATTLRAPVLIISLAVLVTVASLFASAWPGPPRQPAVQRTANTTPGPVTTLPALELVATDGQTVPLRGRLPAVILLVDGCACAALVSDTIDAVGPEIAVITVSAATASASAAGTPPTGAMPPANGKTVRVLNDPTGTLRSHLHLGTPDTTAAAVLVDRGSRIVRTVPRTASIEDFRADLARL